MFVLFCVSVTQDKKSDLIDPEVDESKVKSLLSEHVHVNTYKKKIIIGF